ncbi:ATP-binding cassette domain-containing protein [Nocardia puris]|uniref:ABC-2 type transport system ATP-binding protein n=1 Tax=Nocardia puris TaxID=208602 RepID=A0A366DWN5_9NOCA|nr:ATP-binding cassette domain-containing protein [Nocardia puris]MBF6209801.1 ATP-binding cassette domain-containing protein [Nocardia puris]MBF6366373.1 ATP-binding cassette domain-containing protein [Nocardia puris]MBF6458288.1 ATP-binding cassette domain-containing protein [Nocardia puris]RBO94462.1 ABC-2 type transport system ATP-binding protein [Nocardia puris]
MALELHGLRKYFGEIVALEDVSLRVGPGEILGFVGSNGAGKSTTMRIVLGVLAADAGTVVFDGAPVDFAARQRFGYMPEERGLYPRMQVGEQLEFLAELHGLTRADARAEIRRWAERLGIADKLDRPLQELSLGNQQRVQLAAALVHRPALLVLDEPFSGLDPVAVDMMSEVLRERADAGVPVMFSSHQLELVERLCDRVGIIVAGRIRADGTVSELRSRGARRLEVSVSDAPATWAGGLSGVRVLSHVGAADGAPPATVLELDDAVDDQTVLRHALAAGPVRHFASHRPTLTELYREVVAS